MTGVRRYSFSFSGVQYFRTQAENQLLGSIGRKQVNFLRSPYLQVVDQIPIPDLGKAEVTTADVTFDSKVGFGPSLTFPAIIQGQLTTISIGTNVDQKNSSELKLVKFIVPTNILRTVANNSPKILKEFKILGREARIVHQIFVVIEATEAKQFQIGGEVSLGLGIDGAIEANIKGNLSTGNSTTLKLSKNTCFAYLLAAIEWNEDQTEIIGLTDDQFGPDISLSLPRRQLDQKR